MAPGGYDCAAGTDQAGVEHPVSYPDIYGRVLQHQNLSNTKVCRTMSFLTWTKIHHVVEEKFRRVTFIALMDILKGL